MATLILSLCFVSLFVLFVAGFLYLTGKNRNAQEARLNDQVSAALAEIRNDLRSNALIFQETNTSVGNRMQGASMLVSEVQNRLGKLEEANNRILALGESLDREVNGLQAILQAPKARGGWGEIFLGDLLSDILSDENVQIQYAFRSGERVDAVVKLPHGMICIDAKFPLENYRRFISSSIETERKAHLREFIKDFRRHIDDIGNKYILPDEGTLDFALMYVPAEAIYYEVMVRSDYEEFNSVREYALSKRVVPVSPSTLYAYLSSIARGLQGFKVEFHAREILSNIQRLRGDLERFEEDFKKIGGHLKNASLCYDKANRQFDKVNDKISVCNLVQEETVFLEKAPL